MEQLAKKKTKKTLINRKNLFVAVAMGGVRNPSACFSLWGFTAGELVGSDEATELDGGGGENGARASGSQDPAALRLIEVMTELGADKVFKE